MIKQTNKQTHFQRDEEKNDFELKISYLVGGVSVVAFAF